jgi:hypothetical protein
MQDTNDDSDDGWYSISNLSLRQIAEVYQFPLKFLGNFAAQAGCKTPIDVDVRVDSYMYGHTMKELVRAVTSLDPSDTMVGFFQSSSNSQLSLEALAKQNEVPLSEILEVCAQEGLLLPFGANTVLEEGELRRLQLKLQYRKEADDELQQEQQEQG